jgi:signal transduction histidine kinase
LKISITLRAYSSLVFVILLTHLGYTQISNSPTIFPVLVINDEISSYPIGENIRFFTDTTKLLSPTQAGDKINEFGVTKPLKGRFITFEKGKYNNWGRFCLNNTDTTIQSLIFKLHNPYLDKVKLYKYVDKKLILIGKSGDEIYLKERTIAHREHVFEINLEPQSRETYLVVFERWGQNAVSFELVKTSKFIEADLSNSILLGIFLGVLLILGVYAILIYFFLHRRIFLLYGIYTLLSAFSLANINGIGYRYIYANLPDYSSFFTPITVFLILVTFTLLSLEFLNVKKYAPRINRFIYRYIIAYISIAIVLTTALTIGYKINVLPIHYTLVLTTILLLGFTAVRVFKSNKKAVIFYLASFSPLVIAAIIRVLHETGIAVFDLPTEYILMLGSTIEILILSAGISVQLRDDYLLRIKLSKEVVGHEKRLAQKIIEGENQEKRRIALVLHDTIGVKLRRINALVRDSETSSALGELDNLAAEIRDLSHLMAPTILDYVSLKEAISDIAYSISTEEFTVKMVNNDFPESLSKKLTTVLYNVIQELLNNVVKHSESSQVTIQFTKVDQLLLITIEDNGIGFDPKKVSAMGLGLASIESRITGLNGQFHTESTPGKGTMSIIELPLEDSDIT